MRSLSEWEMPSPKVLRSTNLAGEPKTLASFRSAPGKAVTVGVDSDGISRPITSASRMRACVRHRRRETLEWVGDPFRTPLFAVAVMWGHRAATRLPSVRGSSVGPGAAGWTGAGRWGQAARGWAVGPSPDIVAWRDERWPCPPRCPAGTATATRPRRRWFAPMARLPGRVKDFASFGVHHQGVASMAGNSDHSAAYPKSALASVISATAKPVPVMRNQRPRRVPPEGASDVSTPGVAIGAAVEDYVRCGSSAAR